MKRSDEHDLRTNEDDMDRHVTECLDCARQSEKLDEMFASLGEHKEVFCPDLWRLYDYASTGKDPKTAISRHLERCEKCQEDVAAFKEGLVGVPTEASSACEPAETRSPRRSLAMGSAGDGLFDRVREFFRSFFAVSGMVATAAAICLAVVLAYPREEVRTVMGLGSVAWVPPDDIQMMTPETPGEPIKKPPNPFIRKAVGKGEPAEPAAPRQLAPAEKRERPPVALMLLFRGFAEPWPQDRIDALYEAITPGSSVADSWTVLSPADIKASLKPRQSEKVNLAAVAGQLGQDLKAARVLFLTLSPSGDRFEIEAALTDPETGSTATSATRKGVAGTELADKLSETIHAILVPYDTNVRSVK